MLILLKSLMPKLTAIAGSTRSDGVEVAPYMAVRHVRAPEPAQPPQEEPAPVPAMPPIVDPAPPPMDGFSALLAEMEALAPAPDPELAAIDDRMDLAEAVAEDPHSDRTKQLLRVMAIKELDRIAEVTPELRAVLAALEPPISSPAPEPIAGVSP